MMRLSTIRHLAQEQAARAAEKGLEPLICWDADDLYHMPNLGDHRPEGWDLVTEYFISKTPGGDGGPAMSIETFKKSFNPGSAYAITEEGQYQMYIGEFVPSDEPLFEEVEKGRDGA